MTTVNQHFFKNPASGKMEDTADSSVKCDPHTFPVHRKVVCTRSAVFATV